MPVFRGDDGGAFEVYQVAEKLLNEEAHALLS
jgi:hypothetical protein